MDRPLDDKRVYGLGTDVASDFIGPDVSVVVPVYNVEEELVRRCLSSVARQTYPSFEVILVDDGSDDCHSNSYMNMCEELGVRYIGQRHRGVSAARNVGIEASRGAWLCFVDSDDIAEPTMLEVLLGAARSQGADIACGAVVMEQDAQVSDQPGEVCSLDGSDAVRCMLQYGGPCVLGNGWSEMKLNTSWAKVFRRGVLQDIRFSEDMCYGEDTLFNIEAFLSVRCVAFTGAVVYRYIRRRGSASQSEGTAVLESRVRYLQAVYHLANKGDASLRKAALSECVRVSVGIASTFRKMSMLTESRCARVFAVECLGLEDGLNIGWKTWCSLALLFCPAWLDRQVHAVWRWLKRLMGSVIGRRCVA